MRHFIFFVVIYFTALTAFAEQAVVLKFTERSFKISADFGSLPIGSPESLDEIKLQLKDPKIDRNQIIFFLVDQTSKMYGKNIYASIRSQIEKKLNSFNTETSAQVEKYVYETALKHGAKKHREGTTTFLTIENGLGFFEDLFKFEAQKDLFFKAAVSSVFNNVSREANFADKTEKLAIATYSERSAETRLFSLTDFSEADMKSLQRIATLGDREGRYEKVGNVWVFGGGISYILTKNLLKTGFAQTDLALKKKFDKIVRYHVAFGIPVTHDNKQGNVAYFNPADGKMTFVLPGRATTNVYTHEMTHSRFDKFIKTLDAWITSKNYRVPFQVDGPPTAAFLESHGGLFNLLNEVNSWRIGESFDGKNSDAEIIKILKERYGAQAGYEATEMLEKVWTPQKLAGKSVPYLIYDEIRRFNKLSEADLVNMGYEGVIEHDLIKKMNFLIMYQTKRFLGTPSEADAQFVLEEIAKSSEEKSVKEKLARIDRRFRAEQEKAENKKDYSKLPFQEIFEDLVKMGSQDAANELKDNHIQEILPEHMQGLVQRGLGEKISLFGNITIDIIKEVFKQNKMADAVSVDDKHKVKIRKPLVGNAYIEALDKALVANVFDGGIATKKMDLVNFVAQNTIPEELPRTYAKVIDVLMNDEVRSPSDFWVARIFFLTSDKATKGAEVLWGEKLIQDLLGKPGVSTAVREAMGFFYKEAMGPFLLDGSSGYGNYANSKLNTEQRQKYLKEMNSMSPGQKERLEQASRNLWILAGDSERLVRDAALFAILSNPKFMIQNEGRMLQAIYSRDVAHTAAVNFFVTVGPEMVPEATRLRVIQIKKYGGLPEAFSKINAPAAKSCVGLF